MTDSTIIKAFETVARALRACPSLIPTDELEDVIREMKHPRCREAEGEDACVNRIWKAWSDGDIVACKDALREAFRAGRSQPIDGFYRDGVHRKDCPCAECNKAKEGEETRPAEWDECRNCSSPDSLMWICDTCWKEYDKFHPVCSRCRGELDAENTPNADRKEQMTEAEYEAERKRLIEECIKVKCRNDDPCDSPNWGTVASGLEIPCDVFHRQIASLDQRYQSQKKEPTCDECGKPFTSMLGERSCFDCCKKSPNPFRERKKVRPPPASDEAEKIIDRHKPVKNIGVSLWVGCAVREGIALGRAEVLEKERVRRASDAALKNVKPDMQYYAEMAIVDFVEQLRKLP